ncbi:MAG: dTMP kinase [Thermoplasmata archaeon]|nr:dTMP kinase [Thermoplasmata archaeon]
MRQRGLLVTFEGIDGSGKSTALRAVAQQLRAAGHDAREHAEPTPTWLGESVRRALREHANPWSVALLFMADHAEHVLAVERELAEGALVLSDRWSDSTFAYQGAVLGTPAFDAVRWLRETERAFDRAPDLTLLFDLPVEEALRRVGARGQAIEAFERRDLLEKVRANYLRLAKEEPRRFVGLDAAGAPDAVARDAARHVLDRASSRQA